MNTALIPNATENDCQKILNALKKRGHATSYDLSDDTGINRTKVKTIMQKAIIPTYPEASSEPRRGYFWKEQPKPVAPEVKKPERYAEPRNSEGYMDPTASAAIKNMPNGKYVPGDIWSTSEYVANGESLFLILAEDSKGKALIGLPVIPVDQWYNEWTDVTVNIKGRIYYVRTTRIGWKRERVMSRSRETVPHKDFEQIKMKVATYLGLQTVEVEKIVEKEVEVPVEVEKIVEKEVIVEGTSEKAKHKIEELEQAVDDLEAELELANQRGDIWEKAFTTAFGHKEA